MADDSNSLIQECTTCGILIDVAGEEPFALKQCPSCEAAQRVRVRLDHFELQEELGAGGMGTVYRALDRNLGRQVALKLLQKEQSTNPEFIAQFAREAAITASISHPHVVKVFSTGQDHGRVYIAMELVDKGSLDERLVAEERMPEEEVLSTGIQIAEGLNAAYQRGLIHRDVKPGNILFASARTAKIVDFGLAVLMEHASTVMGEVWGTPGYVAPEKLANQPEDLRSDLYSLGATLFHALAGAPPCNLETNQMSELLAAKRKQPSLRSVARDVTEATAFAIDKALKFDPAERFQTYEELIKALEHARSALLAAEAAGMRAPKKKPHWLPYAAAGVAAVVVVGLLVFMSRDWRKNKPTTEQEEESKGGGGTDRSYQAARMLLAGSDGARAAKAFRELESLPNVPQPRLNWITLHAGLAEFLAGRLDEGREEFAKIAERGAFSTNPTEQRLAEFFVALAKLAAAETAVPSAAVQEMQPEGEENIALLVGALKDWTMKDYDNAEVLLAEFNSAVLPPKDSWVADYKALTASIEADYAACSVATAAGKAATTLPEYEAALTTVQAAHAKLAHPSALGPRLETLATNLRMKISVEKSAEAARLVALAAAEHKAVEETKAKLVALCGQLRYTEALNAAKAVQVSSETEKRLLTSMVTKTAWLARFKATLISDLTTAGYPEPVIKKNKLPISGGIHRANEAQVEIVSQFGVVPVPWTEISNECIFAMGQSLLRQARTADNLADRQWQLGVFALFSGMDAKGREMLILAARGKDEYRLQLGLFIGIAESL